MGKLPFNWIDNSNCWSGDIGGGGSGGGTKNSLDGIDKLPKKKNKEEEMGETRNSAAQTITIGWRDVRETCSDTGESFRVHWETKSRFNSK